MTLGHSRLRLLVLAGVFTLAAVNAMALWGKSVAGVVEHVLQVGVGVAAIVCGLTVARRQRGTERWWRLVFVAALVNWVLGQTLWRLHVADWAPVLARASRTRARKRMVVGPCVRWTEFGGRKLNGRNGVRST